MTMHPVEWRNVPGFGSKYIVSSLGAVRNIDSGRLLFGELPEDGYRRINLCHGASRKKRRLHQLICEAFHGPKPFAGAEVAHLDGNKLNNAASNLAWVSHAENMAHKIDHGTSLRGTAHPRARLTEQQVLEVWHSNESSGDIAARFGVSKAAISDIRIGRRWMHITQSGSMRSTKAGSGPKGAIQ